MFPCRHPFVHYFPIASPHHHRVRSDRLCRLMPLRPHHTATLITPRLCVAVNCVHSKVVIVTRLCARLFAVLYAASKSPAESVLPQVSASSSPGPHGTLPVDPLPSRSASTSHGAAVSVLPTATATVSPGGILPSSTSSPVVVIAESSSECEGPPPSPSLPVL